MHLFKRSKSTIAKKQQDTNLPSSSRPPLTNNNRDLPTADEFLSSPSKLSDFEGQHLIGRKISVRQADEYGKTRASQSVASISTEPFTALGLAPAPPRTSNRSAKTTYANHPDLYTHNDLNTFSFGVAPTSSSSHPIDPLSRPRDDADTDEFAPFPDTTPRPSVIGSQHPRSHQSHHPSLGDWQTPSFDPRLKSLVRAARSGEKLNARDSDTASAHTFGTSSASISVSSLSAQKEANSRGTSRASVRSSITPQTSADDFSSDEELDGRHPLPPDSLDTPAPRCIGNPEQGSLLYLSEEDLDGYTEEVDSEAHEGSDRGTLFDYQHEHANGHSFRTDYSERRGSAVMQIPNTGLHRAYQDHRPSLATVRRPSKSLEDLHSFSFGKASGSPSDASRGPEERPPSVAPTSVPESEGDWRDLRKKSVQRDKDLPPLFPLSSSSFTGASTSRPNVNMSAADPCSASDGLGFDTSWMQSYGVNGVVGFDLSEMTDIVVEGHNGHRPSLYSFRKGSTSSAFRRQSTVSSMDIMHKNINGVWANQKYKDQRQMWTFTKEKDRIEDVNTKNRPHLEKERPSISTLFGSRPNTSSGLDSSLGGSISFFDKPETKEKEKATIKEKAPKELWRGMALDSEEIWNNGSSGRFRVNRKNATSVEPGKPPQQRLNISYLRSPYILNATNRDAADGPAVTIHRHSKAGAFSIGRHYRAKIVPSTHDTSLRSPSSTTKTLVSSNDSADGATKKSNMILLAPRRVQKSYTSTKTTRKLESHGLLDESGSTSPRDRERMRREEECERRAREKKKEKERNDRNKDKDKRKTMESSSKRPVVKGGDSKGNTKSRDVTMAQNAVPESSGGSSAGSVANVFSSGDSVTLVNGSTAASTSDPSDATSSTGSVERSIMTQETTSSDRTISHQNFYRNYPRRHATHEVDDDDSSDERPRYPTRTPHRETYAALPPEVFESAHQEHPSHGLFHWAKSRDGDRGGHRANAYLEASYKPPWPVTQPRSNSETRRGIVDDLNMSFQDVGLLPAIGEIKNSSHNSHRRRREHQNRHSKRPTDKNQTDVFEEVPEDALYMLLPLWPGETDPNSTRKYPHTPNPIPAHSRRYLLVYYKALPPLPTLRQEEGNKSEKKRAWDPPAPQLDPPNERAVLLSNFHITARVVSYRDLQGSGVRIPDVGLAVSGPLLDAYEYLPSSIRDDYLIGFCHSRESGVEFVPEGFEKMGLTRNIPNPRAAESHEDDDSGSFDTLTVLTPIGRAVMEMAWLGGMAVTSFNPNA